MELLTLNQSSFDLFSERSNIKAFLILPLIFFFQVSFLNFRLGSTLWAAGCVYRGGQADLLIVGVKQKLRRSFCVSHFRSFLNVKID